MGNWNGVPVSTSAAVLQDLVNGYFEDLTSTIISADDFTEVVGGPFPWRLKYAPINSVASITNLLSGQALQAGAPTSGNDLYFIEDYNQPTGRLYPMPGAVIESGPWVITYNAGYGTNLPNKISFVLTELYNESLAIENLMANGKTSGLYDSETDNGYSRTFMDKLKHELYHLHAAELNLLIRY